MRSEQLGLVAGLRAGLAEVWAGLAHVGIEPQQWLYLRKQGEKKEKKGKRRGGKKNKIKQNK